MDSLPRLNLNDISLAADYVGAAEVGNRFNGSSFLLHVGSCIARKRIDVLLEVFAKLKSHWPNLQLMQVGGEWTPDLWQQIKRLGISEAVHQRRGINRSMLAVLYRQAFAVLHPSEAEGFGLPVLEALACGAMVVASDIPVLREVGGPGVVYCPVANISSWVETCSRLLGDASAAPNRINRINQARRFSWENQASIILSAYDNLIC
jgi:glycosyltransferase involved in cell wall biosynthesis